MTSGTAAAPAPAPTGHGASWRVLHVASAASSLVRFCLPITDAQRARGYDIEFACRDQPEFVQELRDAGYRVHVVDLPRRPRPSTARGFLQLRDLIRRGGYHAVHLHQPMAALIGIPAARAAGQRVVLYTTGGFKAHDGMPGPLRRAVSAVEGMLYRQCAAVFSVNREDIAFARAAGLVPADRMIYTGAREGGGIDSTRFRPADPAEHAALRARFGLPAAGSALVVGTVARTVWEKGYRELLTALASLPPHIGGVPVHLAAAGGGADLDAIRDTASALGVADRVHFVGERSDIPEFLRTLDLFVLPSYREGLPTALLEAMASGLPVVASAIRGSREVLDHDRNGVLVPARDAAALAAELQRLLADPSLRRSLAATALADVGADHARAVLLPRYLAAYDDLLDRCRAPHRANGAGAIPGDTV